MIGTTVCAIALAIAFITLGAAKVLVHPAMVNRATQVGFSSRAYQAIGSLEIAGAIGVLVGLVWQSVGIVAALGLIALMTGATMVHQRHRSPVVELLPAIALGLLAAGYLVASLSLP